MKKHIIFDGSPLKSREENEPAHPIVILNQRLKSDGSKEFLIEMPEKELWLPFDYVESKDILAYYKSLAQRNRIPKGRNRRAILFYKFVTVKEEDLEKLLQSYATPSGLDFPETHQTDIDSKLNKLKKEFNPRIEPNYVHEICELRKAIATKKIIDKRRQQQEMLENIADDMNARLNGKRKYLENNFDAGLLNVPSDFTFINDYRSKPEFNYRLRPTKGCTCIDDCNSGFCTCIKAPKLYYQNKKLKSEIIGPNGNAIENIYECGENCQCECFSCGNRAVSKICHYSLVLFRTFNSCGWGVRTNEQIDEGSFIFIYVGDIKSPEEKEELNSPYLFALAPDGNNCHTVDALKAGNLSRFVNHSCEPNLCKAIVFINCTDKRFPEIAFFASRLIRAGEELTIDYGTNYQLICKCGKRKCYHDSDSMTGEKSSIMTATINDIDD